MQARHSHHTLSNVPQPLSSIFLADVAGCSIELVKSGGCANCNARWRCTPFGLHGDDATFFNNIVIGQCKVECGTRLFNHGDEFHNLYFVRAGMFKSSVPTHSGLDRVIGFQMAGEVLGIDGLAGGHHRCDSIALDDSEVCVMPYLLVERATRRAAILQRLVHKTMSREIVRENRLLTMLSNLNADQRVAEFLLDLVERMHSRGFSKSEVILRMTRTEIGSYLGITVGTVSRSFTRLVAQGLLTVKHRHVCITNPPALEEFANSGVGV